MDLKVDELVRLKIGEFYLQIGNNRVIKIKTPTALLGDRNAMTEEQLKKLLKEQLKLFYRELSRNRGKDHITLGSTTKSGKCEQQELDSKLQKLSPKYKH